MNESYSDRLKNAAAAVRSADMILIGGGAGLSAAAGLIYGGERFSSHFPDFMARYGMTDMYSAGFYPFASQEEKWAYWSRHILLNRFDPVAGQVYLDLFGMIRHTDYFVVTTNVDAQFYKAGFDSEGVFAVQGNYGKFQCARGCHDTLYDNENLVRRMAAEQTECRIPSRLVPACPRCGGLMEINIRKDGFFVEDAAWRTAKGLYETFLARTAGRRLVLLELGVGYNTPVIIKFPFERIAAGHPEAVLIRINRDYPEVSELNRGKTIVFGEEIQDVLGELRRLL